MTVWISTAAKQASSVSLNIMMRLSASYEIKIAPLYVKIGNANCLILTIILAKWVIPYFLVVDVNPLKSETKTVTSSS